MFFISLALNYINIETLIINFLKQKKIVRLFQEQNTIFDELPNGLILHKEDQSEDMIRIHHINKLFKSMFSNYLNTTDSLIRTTGQGFDKYGRPEEDSMDDEETRQINLSRNLLDKVIIQKTEFKISDFAITQQIDKVIEKPMSLLKSMPNIESGRVYSIVPRNTQKK